ncbi:MAG: phosphoribosylformylglycinamidine synthase subunit PurQ [Armatimonadota bacterium]
MTVAAPTLSDSPSRTFRWGVVLFPGSNCEHDTVHVLRDVLGYEAEIVWHAEQDLSCYDGLVLPGGFAHGDYLRAGAVARFSPIMDAVTRFAETGKPVIGICNGFQVLLEAGLLPGAMLRNRKGYVCRWVHLRVENTDSPFLSGYREGEVLRIPIAHGEGNYYADPDVLARMEENRQILLRYCDPAGELSEVANPNGATAHIAGISNERGNVMGLMPHPERASEEELGSVDGRRMFESIVRSFGRANSEG